MIYLWQIMDKAIPLNWGFHSQLIRCNMPEGHCSGSCCILLQEKRKRELGQAKKDKNYVEEEKRLARGFGIHSGFDQ